MHAGPLSPSPRCTLLAGPVCAAKHHARVSPHETCSLAGCRLARHLLAWKPARGKQSPEMTWAIAVNCLQTRRHMGAVRIGLGPDADIDAFAVIKHRIPSMVGRGRCSEKHHVPSTSLLARSASIARGPSTTSAIGAAGPLHGSYSAACISASWASTSEVIQKSGKGTCQTGPVLAPLVRLVGTRTSTS